MAAAVTGIAGLKHLYEIGMAKAYCGEHDKHRENKGAYITCLDDELYCDNWLSENGLKLLRTFPKDQPWFLTINFTGDPMDVTQAMHDAWKDVEFPMPVNNKPTNFTYDDHQRNRQYYAAMIENIDRQIGRFIDKDCPFRIF